MESSASISVILRTLDRNDQLAEALESLAKQTCRNFEVVVVDMNNSSVAAVLELAHVNVTSRTGKEDPEFVPAEAVA